MRRRLSATILAIVGLGVPVLVAFLSRRTDDDRPVPTSAPHTTEALSGPLGPAGAPIATGQPSGGDSARPILEPHPTGLFAAIGRFDYRFRRTLPVLGLALVLGLNVWAGVGGGKLIQGGWFIPGSEEQQEATLIAQRFGQQPTTMLVVYRDPEGNAASDGFQAKVKASLVDVLKDPVAYGLVTYADTRSPQLLSRDGTETLAVIKLTKPIEDSVEDAGRLAGKVHAPPGVPTQITGIPQVYKEFNAKIEHDLVQAETISLPIALLILLAVFGTLVAAGLPLLMAALALPSTFAVISILANVTDMSVFVTNLASMIGLALAIDYSLFMVSRFREELRHHSVEIAIERMMGSVGRAVAVSGVAVAIGLSSLTVFEASALRSMGYAGIITVVSTLVFALTVLPAMLAMLGPRVNRFRVPLPRRLRLIEDDTAAADRRQGHGLWAWIAARVMRRPLLIAGPILALLLLAGAPFLSLQLSTGQNITDLPDTPARSGFLTLAKDFPGGQSDPIAVAVTWSGSNLDGSLDTARQASLSAYISRVMKLTGVTDVLSALTAPPGVPADQYSALLAMRAGQRPAAAAAMGTYLKDWIGGDTTRVIVYSKLLPDSDAGRELVAQVRGLAAPAGSQVLTGGLPSRSADFMASFRSSVPVAVLIVVVVTAGVLFLTFGSVFLPVKAVLMSLISISASFGALVWLFQQGHLSGLLGFEPSGAIGAWLPVIMFAILFGLSMDYEVLLLSRIRERYLATGNNTRAVAEGIGLTGGTITGAALIMVAVFAAFGLSSILFIKALGIIQALAVLIDATLVRGLLVPAFMRVMGRVNWWAPRWVQRAVSRLGLYEDAESVRHTQLPAPDAAPATGGFAAS
ncbi:MAG: MMPL family transporter [Chloroflexi bacterium]|nr:MAG: MMPL family transporter [Chloroflexota bacterium]